MLTVAPKTVISVIKCYKNKSLYENYSNTFIILGLGICEHYALLLIRICNVLVRLMTTL